jgi:hypothetical protein
VPSSKMSSKIDFCRLAKYLMPWAMTLPQVKTGSFSRSSRIGRNRLRSQRRGFNNEGPRLSLSRALQTTISVPTNAGQCVIAWLIIRSPLRPITIMSDLSRKDLR